MITALRIFAVLFLLSTGIAALAWGASGFSAAGMVSVIAAALASALCAAASVALEKLTAIEKHAHCLAYETIAMHRTMALNAPLQNAAE